MPGLLRLSGKTCGWSFAGKHRRVRICRMRLPGSHGRAGRGLWVLVLLPMVEGLVQESGSSQALGLQCLLQCCCSGPRSSGSEPLVEKQPESTLAGAVLGQALVPAQPWAVPIPTAQANGTLGSSWARLTGQILQHTHVPSCHNSLTRALPSGWDRMSSHTAALSPAYGQGPH